MWQAKYASAVPINLGLGFDFWLCSEGEKSATSKMISAHCVTAVGLFLPGELDPIQYRETTHNVNKISV
jgi:hypothetical protein